MIVTASAFAPAKQSKSVSSSLKDSLNGWVPDDATLVQMKNYREAETTHGRVAMLATIGFLVTEAPLKYHPLFQTADKDIGPAIRHLDEVRATAPFFFEILALVIGAAELGRALKGWQDPSSVTQSGNILKDDYFPGDIG